MIAYKYRFHGHGSLRYLYRKGQTARSRALLLRYIANPRRSESRAVVIVSKKVVKSAVKRNRIRRRIYEILRHHWPRLTGQVDFSVTVFSAEVGTMPSIELEDMVLDVLHQAKLIDSSNLPLAE